MKVLTYTVKNNDCSIDRITYDCKHAGNKCITDRYSGNSIECKYNQNIMQKRQYRTACKTDVFKSEPDIKKHTDCSYYNGYDRITTHFTTYCRRNTFCGNRTVIYTKFLNQCTLQSFTFALIQRTCLDHNLICSDYLCRLNIFISCHLFYNRSYFRINGLNIHIFIKCNSRRSTA